MKKYYNNYKLTEEETIYAMLGLELEELKQIEGRDDIVKEFRESVEEANKDELVVKWFTPEQEREMRENYIKSGFQDSLRERKANGRVEHGA